MEWVGDQVAVVGGEDFPAAVIALVTLVTVGVAAWAVVLAATPRTLRGAMYLGVTGALAVPAAQADELGVDGLRLPDRPVVTGTAHAGVTVVHAGDTLWAIAASHLPADAGHASIARAVGDWHAANIEVIGPNPDLIHPGQRLTPPKDRP